MSQVVIAQPILNSPFSEPHRHFRFDDDGITNENEKHRTEHLIPGRVNLWRQKHQTGGREAHVEAD